MLLSLSLPKFESVFGCVPVRLMLVFGLGLVSGLESRLFYNETHHRTVPGTYEFRTTAISSQLSVLLFEMPLWHTPFTYPNRTPSRSNTNSMRAASSSLSHLSRFFVGTTSMATSISASDILAVNLSMLVVCCGCHGDL